MWNTKKSLSCLFAAVQVQTTTKPFVSSIWGRLYEPKENYAGSGTWISSLHSFLLSNMPSLRLLAFISYRITSIHVFFGLPCTLLTCPNLLLFRSLGVMWVSSAASSERFLCHPLRDAILAIDNLFKRE